MVSFVQVLQALVGCLPKKLEVVGFMIDFEAAIWTALREVFTKATVKGCVFHLAQSVWRKVQDYGLQIAYNAKKKVHRFVR
jgi:transposase-like protein